VGRRAKRARASRFARLPRWVTRIVRFVAVLLLVLVVPPALFIAFECYGAAPDARAEPSNSSPDDAQLAEYSRDESATYLTFPEWFIVYSTEEYARFIGSRSPSEFPYFGSIGQYWMAYGKVCDATKGRYAFNAGYHLMLGIIGVSFTVENGIKATYEKTIGRLTGWVSTHDTPEDAFAHRTAVEYGRFMHTVPWYEFPFGSKIVALWSETPLWGPHVLRKWERRIALTAEYGAKAIYALAIGGGTQTVYAPEELIIYARLDDVPDVVFRDTRIRMVKKLGERSYVVTLPRYEAFTATALKLVDYGARFRSIAANDEMLVTAVAPRGWDAAMRLHLLLKLPILTDSTRERIGVRAPVTSLHALVRDLRGRGLTVEHLYDY